MHASAAAAPAATPIISSPNTTFAVGTTPVASLPTATAPVSLATPEPESDTTFELGLVMAGAISAGAYTAGVIDFLFEALDSWYNPQLLAAQGWAGPTPPHKVKLKAMAGASAGGMCAALTAVSILDGNTTRFHDAWVNKIDIRPLLDDTDLANVTSLTELQSVLNCGILQQIADAAITLPTKPPVWPGWLYSELNFYLTLTNLNGLVYEVTQQGGASQHFIDHADRIQYRLLAPGRPVPTPPDPALRVLLAAAQRTLAPPQQAIWEELKTAALATGAFPVALLNRQLFFDNPYYDGRVWGYGNTQQPAHVQRDGKPSTGNKPYPAPYLFVDGGLTNNEPLELVRRTLVNDLTGKTTSDPDGTKSRKAAIMIDPFPSDASEFLYAELKRELRYVVPAIYTTLRNQARYRTEDLLGALDLDEHSRFLIAPVRSADTPGAPPPTPSLASGTLGAFGGFLHQPFREHDFQLGRRNCQQFLKQWFTLAADNKLFQDWPAAMRARFTTDSPQGPRLPIIPLLGAGVLQEVPSPPWASARLPTATLEREIAPLLEQRLDHLTALLKEQIPGSWWWLKRGYSWFIQPKLRKAAQQKIMDIVRADLTKADLLA